MKSYQLDWTPKSKKINAFHSRLHSWKIFRSCQFPSRLKLSTRFRNACKKCWKNLSAAPPIKKGGSCLIRSARNHLRQPSFIGVQLTDLLLKHFIDCAIKKAPPLRCWGLNITKTVSEALHLLSGSLRIRASLSVMHLRLCSTLLKHDHFKSNNQIRLSIARRTEGHGLQTYLE